MSQHQQRAKGKFVSRYGITTDFDPNRSPYPMHILDSRGVPIAPLCSWFEFCRQPEWDGTVHTYLSCLIPFFGFLLSRGYEWNAETDRISAHIIEYLKDDLRYYVRRDRQLDGYRLDTTQGTPVAPSTIGVFLAALGSFYDEMIAEGMYPFHNPMISPELLRRKREHLRQIRNAGAPDHAGIRGESHRETSEHFPTAMFRLGRARIWEPGIVGETAEVQQQVRAMVQHMIKHAPNQAIELILLLLRYTGARISEVLEMTAGGYRKCPEPHAAMVKNKGSHGKETKTITFPPGIVKKLHAYIASERAQNDRQHRTRIDELSDMEPIFLNRNGKGYSYEGFLYYWNNLLPQAQQHVAQIDFTPHDIRHLFVSELMGKEDMALEQGIATSKEDYAETIRRAMGWANAETMDIYNHTARQRDSRDNIHAVQCEIEAETERLAQPVNELLAPMTLDGALQICNGNDDDDDDDDDKLALPHFVWRTPERFTLAQAPSPVRARTRPDHTSAA